MAWAACGSCLKGLDVVERAAEGPVLRDRHSTLGMASKFRGRRSISCIWGCLKGLDVVERAAEGPVLRDRRSTLEMACKFRGRRSISCIWGCLKGLNVVERAAEGPVLRDRRSTLEMACKFCGRRGISCIWLYACVAWAAFGSCLKGLDVVERAAEGPVLRDRRSTLGMARKFPGRRSISCVCRARG